MKTKIESASGLRAFLTVLAIAGLLLVLVTPLCGTDSCPMGAAAERMGCSPLEEDCCKTQGHQVPASLAQVPPPAPAALPAGSELAAAAPLPVPESFWREVALLPAILQGVGLHTFLDVFLI
ncbi:MAG TPA: hypothetical protein VJ725_02575 [Thermoanaerobaculia bacterium]|nr:hypothetical protein [Thermoanaerobaculia bacterium]